MGDVVKEGELEDLRDRWKYAIEVAHYNGEPTPAGWEKGPIPIIRTRPERTWLWSDLHFSDRAALEAFGRPFRDVGRMNEHPGEGVAAVRAARRHHHLPGRCRPSERLA